MKNYLVHLRRQLHMYPEIGFDLDKTLEIVKSELDEIGVEYTTEYGKSSIVATVNGEKKGLTIGIRADMDALPIEEENDLPYRSQNVGAMHACGHDAHTAILLGTVKRIHEMRSRIPCCVKFIFQSAEEYTTSGASLLVKDGVTDSLDCILALHCDPSYDCGTIGLSSGVQCAISDGFKLEFLGKSAHVAKKETGVDAIMMAVKAYTDIQLMLSREIPSTEPVIFNAGAFHGGTTNNIICDKAELFCTLRTVKEETAEHLLSKIKSICASEAKISGGKFKLTRTKHYPLLENDEKITELIGIAAKKVIGNGNILSKSVDMIGEDFSYYTQRKPGAMFRLGIRNVEAGITEGLHSSRFNIDENAMEIGVKIFVRFILDNAKGF
ncbi:MAG: amidohydrolase [Ruminococcaceae bacterium]|nr:amidohydrolase [Oscillospiraceae bacterium]